MLVPNLAPASFDYAHTSVPNRDTTKTTARISDEAEAHNARGIAYSENGDQDKAIIAFNKAIELQPDFAEGYNNRGIAYGEKGDFNHAIGDFNKAIEINSNYTAAYTNRGVAYDKMGTFDRALQDYNKAIKQNPNYANAYINRGNAYEDKGDFDCAIADYTKAINLDPNNIDAYNNRGIAYGEKGDFNHAIGDFNKAIEINSNYTAAYTNRGTAYNNQGDFNRAIADYTKAINLDPNNFEDHNNRGVAYGKKGDFDRAIADFNKAIALNPNYAEVYSNRGRAYDNQGDFDRAIEDFNKAIEIKPDFVNAYCIRGITYGKTDDFDRAIKDFNKAIELNPNDANAHCIRGIVYYAKGDFDRAIADFNKAIELDPNDANAYNNRGEAWLHLEEWDKARADLTTARKMGVDIIASFHGEYKSVEAYERANRVKLPEDIAAMLTQPRRSRYPKTEKFLSPDGTSFESPDILNLLAKLRDTGPPLSRYVPTRPTFGLRTGASGAFVVDGATRDQLVTEHPASAEVLKPFLHGRDIRRWGVEKPDRWLIFTHRRIEINRYPAIRKHLEKYRSALSKRAGKQKWYELPTTRSNAELFTQAKLICPNSYDHQTFAVDTDGFYCGDTCYLIPTAETWLCGLLNSRVVEWFYSQASNQLTGEYLRARSRYIQQIPIPNLTPTQKSLIGKIVDYLIFLQGQPTTRGRDLTHSRDFIMLKYFERIIDGLVYESYLREALHQGEKQFFKPLLDERLPQLEEIRGDKMAALQEIFERLYERTHPIRRNLFFLDSVKPIRIIEGKA